LLKCSVTYQADSQRTAECWGDGSWGGGSTGALSPGTRSSQAAKRRRVFHSVRHQRKGRESQTKRQREGGEPACVFVFKLFLSPRSPGSHMPPPTSPEPSHDTGPPSCDEKNLPNFRPPPTPTPAHRLTDEVFLEERPPPRRPKSVTEGGMQMGESEPTQG
jgi:hypothetical protein